MQQLRLPKTPNALPPPNTILFQTTLCDDMVYFFRLLGWHRGAQTRYSMEFWDGLAACVLL